jgi:hypothetical protein
MAALDAAFLAGFQQIEDAVALAKSKEVEAVQFATFQRRTT